MAAVDVFADFVRLFQPPTPLQMAQDELAQAKREMLKAHSAEEYAHHMANYHAERIERLTEFINQQKDPACLSTTLSSGTNEPGPLPQWKTSMSNSVATLKKSLR
jgi:hypothetical protein